MEEWPGSVAKLSLALICAYRINILHPVKPEGHLGIILAVTHSSDLLGMPGSWRDGENCWRIGKILHLLFWTLLEGLSLQLPPSSTPRPFARCTPGLGTLYVFFLNRCFAKLVGKVVLADILLMTWLWGSVGLRQWFLPKIWIWVGGIHTPGEEKERNRNLPVSYYWFSHI